MASTTFPDGAPASVNDLQFEILGSQWAADGLIGTTGETASVYADSTGRQVKFRAGKHALVHGHGWSSGSSDIILPIAANGTSYSRVDMAVLGLDRSTTPWRVTEYIKQGSASAAPVAPSLIRNAPDTGTGKWEHPLALITVGPGVSTINPADITPLPVYVGAQPILVPDLTVLAQIPGPVSGQTARVMLSAGPVDYMYAAATGWRRADWNSSWGTIGGKQYSSGGTLASGITSTNWFNMDSGAVATLAGRRYRAELAFQFQVSVTNVCVGAEIREGGNLGPIRASVLTPFGISTAYRYPLSCAGEWDETSNATRTYLALGSVSSGAMSIYRGLDADKVRLVIKDLGPAGSVTTA